MNINNIGKCIRMWTALAALLFASAMYGQSDFQILRGGLSSSGGSLQAEKLTLLESACGTFATGMSANSGYILLGGMSITGKTQLFSNMSFAGAEAAFSLVFGKEQKNYRLVSIPAQLDNPAPASVLAKLGQYDNKRWRLFDCSDGKNVNVEHPNTRAFLPGVGLFLIVQENPGKMEVGGGYWIGAETFTVPLQRGWNLIGSPYNFELPLDRVTILSSDPADSLAVWDYQGGWKMETTRMLPWHGYALAVSGDAQLVFSPFSVPDTTLLKNRHVQQTVIKPLWSIKIASSCGSFTDDGNEVGTIRKAKVTRDKFDMFKPPSVGDFISLSFPHPEWGAFLSDYAKDFRPSFEDGSTWDFTVRSSLSDKAVLRFSGIEDVPQQFNIALLDCSNQLLTDLRENNSYFFSLEQSSEGKPFQLIVGTAEYIEKATINYNHIPTCYRLLQNYPNPFNPSTTICFELPQGENVHLRIVNALGQEIIELTRGQRYEAGRHTLVWDARNASGDKVGSGVYFYEITAGRWKERKKMVLMQ